MQRNRKWWFFAGIVACLAIVLVGCDSQSESEQAQSATVTLPDFTHIVHRVSPAVVNISALPPEQAEEEDSDAADGDDLQDWFKRFFGPEGPDGMPHFAPHMSLGSGFIISDDGYILTNRHVVRGAGRIVVKLSDRRQLIARVVGADKYSDVALLKVDAEDLPQVAIGDSDQLAVGSWVLAIGSPFGFETSVTAGIVSAKGRNLASEQYVPFIQTDVAINPGNSGGPLFNLDGEVVGINAQIYSRTGGYQGVSFTIPINVAIDVAEQLQTAGQVQRGWLGVQIQDVDREMAQSFGLERPRGALVARVFEGSPAARVGIHAGDIILKFDGKDVATAGALPPLVGTAAPGERVPMTVLRDGKPVDFRVKIGTLPKDLAALDHPDTEQDDTQEQTRSQGLTLELLDSKARERLGVKDHGVRVTTVAAGAGADAGLQSGDIVLAVGKQWVDSPAALVEQLAQADGPVALLVWRDGERLYLALYPQQD